MDEKSICIGDVVTIDAAVFHRAGIDGACHIEEDIEYVAMESDEEDIVLVLTTDEEENLADPVVGALYSITVDNSNGTKSIEKHPQVYSLVDIEKQ